jgi:hypothetical protein
MERNYGFATEHSHQSIVRHTSPQNTTAAKQQISRTTIAKEDCRKCSAIRALEHCRTWSAITPQRHCGAQLPRSAIGEQQKCSELTLAFAEDTTPTDTTFAEDTTPTNTAAVLRRCTFFHSPCLVPNAPYVQYQYPPVKMQANEQE